MAFSLVGGGGHKGGGEMVEAGALTIRRPTIPRDWPDRIRTCNSCYEVAASYTTAAHEAVAGFADIADQGREGNKSKAVLCRLLYQLS